MPIKCNRGTPRYRVKTFKTGKRVRLAFCGKKKVVEVKKYPRARKGKGSLLGIRIDSVRVK